MMVDEGAQPLPPPATLEPLSRPSSASTQASLAQLPGISAFAAGADAAAHSSPQPRSLSTSLPGPQTQFATSSPAATSTGGSNGNLPICQNCATSTTPLWRRDEMGSVLCNACGLFLKLHGRPRPISLKTDVIKSRNRVKTSMRPDLAMKKKSAAAAAAAAAVAAAAVDQNGVVDLQGQAYAATALTARRASQKNGHLDGTDGSLSGAGGLYNAHGSTGAYPMLDDGQYQGQHLQPFGASGTSPGRAVSPVNGERLDGGSQAQDQLIAANSSLKTRVAELEVINDFIQRRLGHYEPPYGSGSGPADGSGAGASGGGGGSSQEAEAAAASHQAAEAELRSQVELLTQSETQLRSQLDESHRRENMLKRRLDELELELKEAKDSLSAYEGNRAKKPRLTSPAADAKLIAELATNGDLDAIRAAAAASAPDSAPASDSAVANDVAPVEDAAKTSSSSEDAPAPDAAAHNGDGEALDGVAVAAAAAAAAAAREALNHAAASNPTTTAEPQPPTSPKP